MKMSEKEIYDYYAYERADGYGKEAIEVLAKINKTSEDEIKAILREQGAYIKEDEPMMSTELKAQIIKDYNEGMVIKDIAERYQLNAHTVYNNLVNWSKKGAVELRPTKNDKPVHKPKTKTEQVVELIAENKPAETAPNNAEYIKIGTAIERLKLLQGIIEVILRENGADYEITGVYALNSSGCCDIEITINNEPYILQMKRAEE